MRKKYIKGIGSFTKAGVISGIGANVITQAGGNAGGIGSLSAFYPVMGTATGAGMALGSLKSLNSRKRRRRKR